MSATVTPQGSVCYQQSHKHTLFVVGASFRIRGYVVEALLPSPFPSYGFSIVRKREQYASSIRGRARGEVERGNAVSIWEETDERTY